MILKYLATPSYSFRFSEYFLIFPLLKLKNLLYEKNNFFIVGFAVVDANDGTENYEYLIESCWGKG